MATGAGKAVGKASATVVEQSGRESARTDALTAARSQIRQREKSSASSSATSSSSTRRRRPAAPPAADSAEPTAAPTAASTPARSSRKRPGVSRTAGTRPPRSGAGYRPTFPAGGGLAGNVAGGVLGLFFWSWVMLPLIQHGPTGVKDMLRAKFFNKGPDGKWLG